MSISSIASGSLTDGFATVSLKGYRLQMTKSILSMACSARSFSSDAIFLARIPPCYISELSSNMHDLVEVRGQQDEAS